MKLDFYPGRYATDKYSIIPVGDVSEYITDEKRTWRCWRSPNTSTGTTPARVGPIRSTTSSAWCTPTTWSTRAWKSTAR